MGRLYDLRHYTPVVLLRYCPACGHTVTQLSVEMARFNYPCAGCKEARLSEFRPILVRKEECMN